MLILLTLLLTVARAQDPTSTSTIWINEVHYDNTGTDNNEFIEVAGLAGVNGGDYKILLYNGASGTSGVLYDETQLSGAFTDQQNGIGFIDIQYAVNGIQNGGKDGIALVYNDGTTDHVVQFLSYEGLVTASDGPAQDLTSTNIGVREGSSTTEGTSLSLQGSGRSYDDFTWNSGVIATPGNVNTGQVITQGTAQITTQEPNQITTDAPPVPITTVWINEVHYDNTGTDNNEFIEVAGLAGVNAGDYNILLYNGASGALYDDVSLTGTFTNQENGIGFIDIQYEVNGIQNGVEDGIALVYNDGTADRVVQFLSYEGLVTAIDGAAQGLTSTDIGVREGSRTTEGTSLSLQGTGRSYNDFTWNSGVKATPGGVNTGQIITCNRYDYINDNQLRTRNEAEAYCESRGSNLATILTEDDLNVAIEIIDSFPVWFQLSSQLNDIGFFTYIESNIDCPKENNGRFSGACLKKKMWVNNKPINCDEKKTKCVSKCARVIPFIGKINNDVSCDTKLKGVLCDCINEQHVELARNDLHIVDNDNDGFWNEMFNNSSNDWIGIILLAGITLFILINNVFLCYWCLGCKEKQIKTKYADENV